MNSDSNHYKGILYSILAGVMWSILAIALKVTLTDLSSVAIVWVRFAIAFLILLGYLLVKRPKALLIFTKPPLKLILASLFLCLNYYGFMKGIEHTSPSIAQVFIQLGPVLFALAGIVIFREKISGLQKIGFAIVVIGFVLFYREHFVGLENHKELMLGVLWVIFGAFSWAVYAILQKQLTKTYSTNQLNIFIYGFSSVILLPFLKYGQFMHLSVGTWMLILFLGINTLVAYGSIALAFKFLEANKVSVIIILNPVLTFVLMYIFTKMQVKWIAPEYFSITSVIGAAMALGGSILVVLFSRRNGR